VVVCGASPKARKTLNAALEDADKRYVALVSGKVKADEGIFDGRLKDARRKRLLEAQTLYRVRERLGRFTLLELRLVTGRKHQLRRHLADAGLPVVGDARYGKVPFERLWLHAESLELPDRTIEAPLPKVLVDHLNSLRESGEGSPTTQD
jgi:23S rRNA-/tRNA-specific pseudouridylate synthase